MKDKLTLHEAIVAVLTEHGGGWMDRDEIAREIARRDLFRRPSDGRHPPSDQIRLRARKPEYQHLFEGSDSSCTRIRLRSRAIAPARKETEEPRGPRDQRARKVHVSGPLPANAKDARSRGAEDRLVAADQPAETSTYEALREQYRPTRLEVLLIGESPPDPGEGELRFFYAPHLSYDNLYRGVATAVYGEEADVDLSDKQRVLKRLSEDGFWLIDAVERPINKAHASARRRAIVEAVPRLIERCQELSPARGVIICHSLVYEATAGGLREAGVRVLHNEPLPFPLGSWRRKFVEGVRDALG